MKHLDNIRLEAATEAKSKEQSLIESVLGKIRELESKNLRESPEVKNIEVKKKKAEKTDDSLARDYLKIIESHHQYEGDLEKFEKNLEKSVREVKTLSDLVNKRKPHLRKEEKLVLVDMLYDLSADREEFRTKDEIMALETLLESEEYKIKSGDSEANPEFAAQLNARIAQLKSSLS